VALLRPPPLPLLAIWPKPVEAVGGRCSPPPVARWAAVGG
jgi:hypothetical protein